MTSLREHADVCGFLSSVRSRGRACGTARRLGVVVCFPTPEPFQLGPVRDDEMARQPSVFKHKPNLLNVAQRHADARGSRSRAEEALSSGESTPEQVLH